MEKKLHPHLDAPTPRHHLPSNLPYQLTHFVGREQELAEVKHLLIAARLLTLTGPGGCGKTRLALEAAGRLAPMFVDGVWLVELADVGDPAVVAEIVAAALGLRQAPGSSVEEVIIDHLRAHETLLILDNCEHLAEACARLARALLRACPQLHILATSRESLGVVGEVVWPVPSLSTPGPNTLATAEDAGADLARFDAVELFLDRATAVQPGFRLTGQNARLVAQICYRLDGLPLAIELAAARVKTLPVEQIAQRLDDRFRLLTSGVRAALPRHQTLRAAIDWSYDLLSNRERALLRRLSVFAGGFTLEAAEEVAGAGAPGGSEDAPFDARQDDVLDTLSHLVDRSLVWMQPQDGQARYGLLETIRHYAWEKLQAAGEAPALQQRHADFFLTLAEATVPQLVTTQRDTQLERLAAELDNLRVALKWAGEAGDVETALRFAGLLWSFWYFEGHLREGRAWLEAILEKDACARLTDADVSHLESASSLLPHPPSLLKAGAHALYGAGMLARLMGDLATARQRLEASAAMARQAGLPELGQYLMDLGLTLLLQGDGSAARYAFEEGVGRLRRLGDTWNLARGLNYFSRVAMEQARHDEAGRLLNESLALFRGLGDQWATAWPLTGLGLLAYRQGEYAKAQAYLEQSAALSEGVGNAEATGTALRMLGDVVWQRGERQQAAALYQKSLISFREVGDKRGVAGCLVSLAGVVSAEQPGRAARLLGVAGALRDMTEARAATPNVFAYDDLVNAVRARMAEPEFSAAWAEGRAMTLEEAVSYAADPPPPLGAPAPSALPSPPPAQPLVEPLTERELEVLRMIAEGLSNREIAQRMVVEVSTVKKHINNIYGKLDAHSRTKALARARDLGLL